MKRVLNRYQLVAIFFRPNTVSEIEYELKFEKRLIFN